MDESVSVRAGALRVILVIAALKRLVVVLRLAAAWGTDAVKSAPSIQTTIRTRLEQRALINI